MEKAWASGFWDGEGSCFVGKKNNLVLSVIGTDKENIERFHRAVDGLGNFGGPYESGGLGTKQVYRWWCEKLSEITLVLDSIFPLLGNCKKNQILSKAEIARFTLTGKERPVISTWLDGHKNRA